MVFFSWINIWTSCQRLAISLIKILSSHKKFWETLFLLINQFYWVLKVLTSFPPTTEKVWDWLMTPQVFFDFNILFCFNVLLSFTRSQLTLRCCCQWCCNSWSSGWSLSRSLNWSLILGSWTSDNFHISLVWRTLIITRCLKSMFTPQFIHVKYYIRIFIWAYLTCFNAIPTLIIFTTVGSMRWVKGGPWLCRATINISTSTIVSI